ncbi:hypothetical protein [Bradyrhizobium sp. Leo121]|uniref:hypothetical protein n=1 Tax=Bradyrhizobium sp. Leo121 TaxID=1571195 RepID=UPI001028D3EE|nr:hypothetical protein [Bradyrhizobium sp. Leo121]RZN18994.1 hypothetical protein CWO90_35655 [Bradyrhizobium sp. Leo121]
MKTMLLLAASSAFLLGAAGQPHAQACKPESFTFQDIEKINFSHVARLSGYSVIEEKKDEQKHQKFDGSGKIYNSPVSLSYDDSRSLSTFLLQQSGFDYQDDVRLSIVRTALSKTGAAMYKDCLAAQVIKVEIPDAAYSQKEFQLTVTWAPTVKDLPPAVDYELRILGGTAEGSEIRTGHIKEKDAKFFKIEKLDSVTQIDLIVGGQKYPSIVIPPTRPVKSVQFFKRFGTYSPPRHGPGNECSDHAYLVAEDGSVAGPDTKICRLCVMRSADGLLLGDTAELEGQLIDASSKTQDPVKSGLEMCATFVAMGRGKNGPRTEVRNGRFYVYEAVAAPTPPAQPLTVQNFLPMQ